MDFNVSRRRALEGSALLRDINTTSGPRENGHRLCEALDSWLPTGGFHAADVEALCLQVCPMKLRTGALTPRDLRLAGWCSGGATKAARYFRRARL